MMTTLTLCRACSRHFRLHEPRCPFCGAAVSDAPRRTLQGIALSPGASRSRRYAASAAFVAGGAMAACGGATDDTAAEKSGGHGGYTTDGGMGDGADVGAGGMTANGAAGAVGNGGRVSAGGRASGGTASGGASTGGRVSTGGTASGGISFGGTASGGAGGVGEARHPCMGSVDPTGRTLCRTTSDCTGFALAQCVLAPPNTGTCRFVTQQCTLDTDCPAGTICQLGDCNSHVCIAACTATSCPAEWMCSGQHCVPVPCNTPGHPCPDGYVCKPNDAAADEHGCFLPHCGKQSDCAPDQDCVASAPGSGCVQHPCKVDGDCACGYCVNALCEPTLGFCYEMIAMPYGCVWPDEELV